MAGREQLITSFRRTSRVAAWTALGIGVVALLGWIVDSPTLRGAFARGVTLKANGACALVLAGTALLLLQEPVVSRRRERAGRALGVAVCAIGALTLLEHLFRIDLRIDQLLFREAPGAAATDMPNRMGPPASIAFVLVGLAIILLDRPTRRGRCPAEGLALGVSAIGLFAVIGFFYGAREMYAVAGYTAISLPMALASLALAIAILFTRPDRGAMALVVADDAGGEVARSLLVPAIVLPFVLGWVAIVGQDLGLFPWQFGTAILVLAFIVWFTSLVWWNASLLSRVTAARARAETAQRDLGRQLGSVLESISQGFLAFDHDGRCTYLNRQAERVLGGQRENLLGRPLDDLFPGGPASPLSAAARRAVSENKAISLEAEYPGLDAWFDIDLVPTDQGLSMFVQDVTERFRREEERRELLESERAARAEAQRANRLKDEFLATVSHELRTPLNAMLGWSQLLVRGVSDPEHQRRGLAAIERNAKLQAQMIEDLLDVSRIISGKLRLEVSRVELLPVLEAAIDTARPAAEARGIRIVRELDPDAGPVNGDPSRLQQIVWNLLSNAVKFTPDGGDVGVRARNGEDGVEITVWDTGKGIRPDLLPQIFGRFWQADSSSTRQYGGLGLGLAIVRHLVELHGGTVRAESAGEAMGSTFAVTLPVARIELEAPARGRRLELDEADSGMEPPNLGGLDVLVVDDEDDSREVIRRALEDRGATVRESSSAVGALNMIAERRPDLLVSDIGMPGTDGYELIRQLRADESDPRARIPAIALTAYARPEDRRRAFVSGFEMHLVKPVSPAELTAAVASLAARTRGSRDGDCDPSPDQWPGSGMSFSQ